MQRFQSGARRVRRVSLYAAAGLSWLLAAGQGLAQSLQAVEGSAGGQCARPLGDCAASDAARQLDLIQQDGKRDAARVQAPQAGAPSFRLPLRAVRFSGAQSVDAGALARLAEPYVGREVGFAELEALAAAVTRMYREQGYFLAEAMVPVQTIRDGDVEISVVEGRLGRVVLNLAEDAPITEARVRAFVERLAPGRPLRAQDYERAMLLLSDQPGILVSSGLQAGAEAGTTDLVLEVAADRRIVLAADADNHGSKEAGRGRIGGTLRLASPLGMGDNLDARAMVSEGNGLNYGRLSWETPLGADGWRAGLGIGRAGYELGGAYAGLQARGVARVVDLSLNYPLIRQRQQNLFLRLSMDVKHLRDEMRALDYTARKRVHGGSVGWSWERRDGFAGGGYWASSGTLYRGRLAILDDLTRLLDRPPVGRETQGDFTKLGWQLSRLQFIAPRHLLYLSVSGQSASRNLDASEKIALGGPRAVRAYASGELLADEGWVATAEWRWAATDEVTPFLFFDAARGDLARDPTPFDGDVRRSLRGAGLGVVWARARDFSLTGTVAWRVNSPAGVADGGDRNPRFFVQLQKVF